MNIKHIFLIDGIGACMSFFSLLGIATYFSTLLGLPPQILYFLSIIPCFFAIYSITCHFFAGKKWRTLLYIIALANLLYCCLTLGILIYFLQQVSLYGVIYFLFEMMIIILLVLKEYHCIKNNTL